MTETNTRVSAVAALACAAVAALLVWAGGTRQAGLNVPAPVAYMAAFVLGIAAARLLQLARGTMGAGDGAAAVILGSLASIGMWIAAGDRAPVCTVGSGARQLASASGAECRAAFGAGAVVALLMATYAAMRWWRGRRAAHVAG